MFYILKFKYKFFTIINYRKYPKVFLIKKREEITETRYMHDIYNYFMHCACTKK